MMLMMDECVVFCKSWGCTYIMLELSFVAIDFQIIRCGYIYMWLCCDEKLSWYESLDV